MGDSSPQPLKVIGDSGQATGEDRVRDTTAFLCPRNDGLGAVRDPKPYPMRRARAVCREGSQIRRSTGRAMTNLRDGDPGRVEPAGSYDGPLHRPRHQTVAADEGTSGRNLRMHQCRHHDCRRVLHVQQQLKDPRQPLPESELIGCGAKVRKLLRDLTCSPRTSNL